MSGRSIAGRLGWGLGDQVLSSATNFALTVAVAREVLPDQFGIFTVTISCFVFILAVVRGLTTDTLLTRPADARDIEFQRSASAALATGLASGVLAGAVLIAIGQLLDPTLGLALICLGCVLPGLLLQDGVRFVAFASGRPRLAFVNDLAWAALQLSSIVVATQLGVESAPVLLLLWGLGGTLCGAFGLVQIRTRPRPALIGEWFRDNRRTWIYHTPENALLNGTNLLAIALVSAIAGFADAASLRVAVNVFGPLAVISLGARAALVPEFARVARRDLGKMHRWAIILSTLLACSGLLWGTAWLLLPAELGRALFGVSWDGARAILALVMLDTVSNLFVVGCFIGIRATGQSHRGLTARIGLAVPRIGVAAYGADLAGARGAATGYAVLAPVQATAWLWQLRQAVRGARGEGAP